MASSDLERIEPTAPAAEHDPGEPPATRRPFDWKLALASLPIAVGVFLIAFGLIRSQTGDDVSDLPDAIEDIHPTPDAVQVLAQTDVLVDLADGYEGRLTVDGLDFETRRLEDFANIDVEPGTQIDVPPGVVFEPGNSTLRFTPGAGIAIETFEQGLHTVRVVYWRTEIGEQEARSYTWTFNVV